MFDAFPWCVVRKNENGNDWIAMEILMESEAKRLAETHTNLKDKGTIGYFAMLRTDAINAGYRN